MGLHDPHLNDQGDDLSGRNSAALRSFGRALTAVGVIGLVLLLIIYLVSDLAYIDVAVPLLVLITLVGLMLMWNGRRR